jgi:hypothetical protein
MISINNAGVCAAGTSWTLRPAAAQAATPAAYHAFTAAHPAMPAAAAIPTQRKRRTAAATDPSVHRGTT